MVTDGPSNDLFVSAQQSIKGADLIKVGLI